MRRAAVWLVASALAPGAAAACSMAPATDLPATRIVSAPFETTAWYGGATDIYPHGALGDGIEAMFLTLAGPRTTAPCGALTVAAGLGQVFEDDHPRLADLDGDGIAEVIAVRSSLTLGAQLVVYRETPDALVEIAATAPIGQPNRWLAPLGAADLDGDGRVEIAYVDRPHLARILRVLRLEGDSLIEVAAVSGVTNHRFGEPAISGGIRNCGTGPEIIVASADWSRVLAVTLAGGTLFARDLGPMGTTLDAALDCR